MEKRLVIALGGNALGNSPKEQLTLVKDTAKTIVDLILEGYKVIVTHGNGPQVGMINLAMEKLDMPFPECGAMSQGYIGYHLQQAIKQELKNRNLNKNVVSLITQVVVDENDNAFKNPTKPIGSFYKKEEADKLVKESGFIFKEDAGRGYRRVVPSPNPKKIVEIDVIKELLENDNVVIVVGGGGIPVVEIENGYKGIAAVIDKDKSAAKLANDLKAEMLVILTAVDRVCINFNKANQKEISRMNCLEAKKYIEEGQFAPGSMLPKVEACLEFVNLNKNSLALITSLNKAKDALKGLTGTIITN
ncbi:carbamate kinase [Clostridium weizhouense]|uniref:Carbamate kinase n=1 Tax=Clostridium weizhouense TaxID=2859781 RepID=A0ABS7APL5_9CLOT|nr:carbamate kinase [Clostridium weizhouense]MBW6410603.1 carbamate kinase [Clostridium weizhouense]